MSFQIGLLQENRRRRMRKNKSNIVVDLQKNKIKRKSPFTFRQEIHFLLNVKTTVCLHSCTHLSSMEKGEGRWEGGGENSVNMYYLRPWSPLYRPWACVHRGDRLPDRPSVRNFCLAQKFGG